MQHTSCSGITARLDADPFSEPCCPFAISCAGASEATSGRNKTPLFERQPSEPVSMVGDVGMLAMSGSSSSSWTGVPCGELQLQFV